MLPQEERRYLAALIHELSRPRLAGSPGARAVEEVLRREFEELGYEITEYPFSFSGWPARYTVPAIGVVYLVATLTAASHLLRGRSERAVSSLLLTPPLLAGVARVASALVESLPWGRVNTSNWLAVPLSRSLRYLVVAHRDSKSQPISTFARSFSALAAVGAWAALLTTAARPLKRARPKAGAPMAATIIAAGSAALAGGALLGCVIGNDSPGALDNASGLAALLGVARREREQGDVAFLVTDGEELWLAGARSAAAWLPGVDAVINLDGLDDEGEFFLIERYGWPPRESAPRVAEAISAAAVELGLRVVRRGLPLGVLTDHLPLARAGHPAVTIMRGGRDSLRRVHRPSDQATRLTAHGARQTVELVCASLDWIRGGRVGSNDCIQRGSELM